MADDNRSRDGNISRAFFSEYKQIKAPDGAPLVNVYWSHANRNMPVIGTAYFIHGYGGSPVEPCMKLPMQYALRSGFDVVAIEGVDLSATCGLEKNISNMTLDRQKNAIFHGLIFANQLRDLNSKYKLVWAHSMSCRALSDLMVDSPMVNLFFDEAVCVNPYFIAPPKVMRSMEKFMRMDPTGKMWETFIQKAQMVQRQIENNTYYVPTCLNNLVCPLPPQWARSPSLPKSKGRRMSRFVSHMRISFILGKSDNMADYNQNMALFGGLRVPYKSLVCIDGANHSFENAQDEYFLASRNILDSICIRRTNANGTEYDLTHPYEKYRNAVRDVYYSAIRDSHNEK